MVHLAEQNPNRRTREIVREGMVQLPELRGPAGGLIAGAAESQGITKRRERQSIKNVKALLREGDSSAIPENMRTIQGIFPSLVNNQRSMQRDEKQFVHEKGDKLYFFVASDLDFMQNASVYCDGTFKLANQVHGYDQLYAFHIKFESSDNTRSFCYTVVSVLLKNKSEKTYKEMLADLKDFYQRRHARELNIKVFHSDREIAFVKAAQEEFPDAQFMMCLVHIDRTLQEQGTKHFGSLWKEDEGLQKFHRMLKKLFYLPFNENEDVRKKCYEYLNSINQLVETPTQKHNALEFAAYFDKWFLKNQYIGIVNINYRRAYLDENFDGDTTNNVSESMNHQLNSRIAPGRLTLARAVETLHALKVDQIGQLVANLENDVNMEKRSESFIAKRFFLRRKIQNFASLPPQEQATRAIR